MNNSSEDIAKLRKLRARSAILCGISSLGIIAHAFAIGVTMPTSLSFAFQVFWLLAVIGLFAGAMYLERRSLTKNKRNWVHISVSLETPTSFDTALWVIGVAGVNTAVAYDALSAFAAVHAALLVFGLQLCR